MDDLYTEKTKLEILKLQNENLKLQKEIEKIDQEKSKVEVEKREILKPWYLKNACWSLITTFLIGVGGFYVALQTNVFGIQELKVKNTKLKDSIVLNQRKVSFYESSLRIIKKTYVTEKKHLEEEISKVQKDKIIKINILERKLIDQQIDVYKKYKSLSKNQIKAVNLPYTSIKINDHSTDSTKNQLQNTVSPMENLLKLLNKINKEEIENYDRKIDSLTKKRKSITP